MYEDETKIVNLDIYFLTPTHTVAASDGRIRADLTKECRKAEVPVTSEERGSGRLLRKHFAGLTAAPLYS